MSKDTVFKAGQYAFEVYYPGEGHTTDNIVIWFSKEKVLYGGCLIKGVDDENLGYLGDANTAAYEQSLINVRQKCRNPKHIIIAHNDWHDLRSLDHSIQMASKLKKSR
jgi:metallo-beta-lactamase class B